MLTLDHKRGLAYPGFIETNILRMYCLYRTLDVKGPWLRRMDDADYPFYGEEARGC